MSWIFKISLVSWCVHLDLDTGVDSKSVNKCKFFNYMTHEGLIPYFNYLNSLL